MTEADTALSLSALQKRLSIAGLLVVAAVAWAFLIAAESAMRSMSGDGLIMQMMWAMMSPSAMWPYLVAAALMWVVMMIAMMIPAVMPMASIYRGIHRGHNASLDTLIFAAGYLLGWSLFAVIAAVVQWWLHGEGQLHGHLLESSSALAAGLLIAAGIYQLTPLKDACLAHCRSPMGFFMAHWRDGHSGALSMGLHHGFYCIGCCWVLMLLMFVGGAMSVLTMALLCAVILAERLLPAGPWVARLPGVILIAWGAVVWFSPTM